MPTARFPSPCADCGRTMVPGEQIRDSGRRGPRGGRLMAHANCGARSNPSSFLPRLPASAYSIPLTYPKASYEEWGPAPHIANWTTYPTYAYEQFYRENPRKKSTKWKGTVTGVGAFTVSTVQLDDGDYETMVFGPGRLQTYQVRHGRAQPAYLVRAHNQIVSEVSEGRHRRSMFEGTRKRYQRNPKKSAKQTEKQRFDAFMARHKNLGYTRAQSLAMWNRGVGIGGQMGSSKAMTRAELADLRDAWAEHTAKWNSNTIGRAVPQPMPNNAGPFVPRMFPTGSPGYPASYTTEPEKKAAKKNPKRYAVHRLRSGRWVIAEDFQGFPAICKTEGAALQLAKELGYSADSVRQISVEVQARSNSRRAMVVPLRAYPNGKKRKVKRSNRRR